MRIWQLPRGAARELSGRGRGRGRGGAGAGRGRWSVGRDSTTRSVSAWACRPRRRSTERSSGSAAAAAAPHAYWCWPRCYYWCGCCCGGAEAAAARPTSLPAGASTLSGSGSPAAVAGEGMETLSSAIKYNYVPRCSYHASRKHVMQCTPRQMHDTARTKAQKGARLIPNYLCTFFTWI